MVESARSTNARALLGGVSTPDGPPDDHRIARKKAVLKFPIANALFSFLGVFVLPVGGAGEPVALVKSSRDLSKIYEVVLSSAIAIGKGNALSSEIFLASPFADTEAHDIKALEKTDKGGSLGSKHHEPLPTLRSHGDPATELTKHLHHDANCGGHAISEIFLTLTLAVCGNEIELGGATTSGLVFKDAKISGSDTCPTNIKVFGSALKGDPPAGLGPPRTSTVSSIAVVAVVRVSSDRTVVRRVDAARIRNCKVIKTVSKCS